MPSSSGQPRSRRVARCRARSRCARLAGPRHPAFAKLAPPPLAGSDLLPRASSHTRRAMAQPQPSQVRPNAASPDSDADWLRPASLGHGHTPVPGPTTPVAGARPPSCHTLPRSSLLSFPCLRIVRAPQVPEESRANLTPWHLVPQAPPNIPTLCPVIRRPSNPPVARRYPLPIARHGRITSPAGHKGNRWHQATWRSGMQSAAGSDTAGMARRAPHAITCTPGPRPPRMAESVGRGDSRVPKPTPTPRVHQHRRAGIIY